MIKLRPTLFPQPWRLLYTGAPRLPTISYLNLPSSVTIKQVSTLSNPCLQSFWDFYALFLRTTRERQGENAIAEWKKDNRRKTIPKKKRDEILAKLSPTSLFHALYRLRLRSNYSDAESFLASLRTQEMPLIFISRCAVLAGIRSSYWNSSLHDTFQRPCLANGWTSSPQWIGMVSGRT